VSKYLNGNFCCHSQARAQARKTDDATRKKAILAIVDELERMLPGQMAASLAVANNPDDDQAKKALDKYPTPLIPSAPFVGDVNNHTTRHDTHDTHNTTHTIHSAMADYTGMLGMLEASIRPDTKDKVPEAAERELANLARLLEQTKKSDARGAEETLRQLEQDNDLLAQHGRGRAARDPSAKSLRVRCRSLFPSFLFLFFSFLSRSFRSFLGFDASGVPLRRRR
jgi:hypothetical protein